jgi:glutaredoxin
MEARGSVSGRPGRPLVRFYGLSTCIWCKRTRKLLEEEGASFDYVYVDLLHDDKDDVMAEVRRFNPRETFPMLVFEDSRCIVGYHPEEIKEALGR